MKRHRRAAEANTTGMCHRALSSKAHGSSQKDKVAELRKAGNRLARGVGRSEVRAILLWLCATLLLAGCSQGSTSLSFTLPDLHGKGVREVPGLSALLKPKLSPQFVALGTYQLATGTPSASSTPAASKVRIVFELGFYDPIGYYDVGTDGSDLHPLALTIPCIEYLSVTRDGQWGACLTNQGIATFRLLPATPAHTPLEEHLVIPNEPKYGLGDISWDPTGRFLAVARVNLPPQETAPLDIYAISPQHDQAQLALRLSGAFALEGVNWSPDGRWLLALPQPGGNGVVIPVEAYQPIFNAVSATGAPPTSVTLSLTHLRHAPYGAWRPNVVNAVTFVGAGLLRQQDIVTGKQTTLANLGFPPQSGVGNACAASWTADGRYFVFALCIPPSLGYATPPAKFFVYTLPSGMQT